jgi:hypothetical protein
LEETVKYVQKNYLGGTDYDMAVASICAVMKTIFIVISTALIMIKIGEALNSGDPVGAKFKELLAEKGTSYLLSTCLIGAVTSGFIGSATGENPSKDAGFFLTFFGLHGKGADVAKATMKAFDNPTTKNTADFKKSSSISKYLAIAVAIGAFAVLASTIFVKNGEPLICIDFIALMIALYALQSSITSMYDKSLSMVSRAITFNAGIISLTSVVATIGIHIKDSKY